MMDNATTMQSSFFIPTASCRNAVTIKKSKFIATIGHADSVEKAKAFIETVRKEFTDATHNCWAFNAGPAGTSGQCGLSDDGEPHGTAGKPMLNVLLHSNIGEIVAVVTRYFGGTKLGTGGLVRAYSHAVQNALDHLPVAEKRTYESITLTVDYPALDPLRHILDRLGAHITAETYTDRVSLTIRVPKEHHIELQEVLNRL